jgi:hypothetical protein
VRASHTRLLSRPNSRSLVAAPRALLFDPPTELQKEEDDANHEVDFLLLDELEDAYEHEAPLHAELIHTMIPYEETAEEKEVVKRTWTLDRVPASLEKQFSDYKDWRLSPLNFQRQGNAVVDTTANSDRGTTQRFLAYCQAEHGIAPTLATFGTAQLATLAQSWLEKLSERGLMWSTLGNYCNSLCNLAAYFWGSDGVVEEAALEMDVQPPDLLLRLRAQCESQSTQQRLYAKKPDNWLEVRAKRRAPPRPTHERPTPVSPFVRAQWDKAQEARVKCAAEWANSGRLSHDKKVALLKEYLVLLFHTVMPPDRVGIVSRRHSNSRPQLACDVAHCASSPPVDRCASFDGATR